MNTQWQTFLQENNAQCDETGAVITFGQPELERFLIKNGPVISSQAHLGLIKVSGEDAFTFLQGQFTNDLKEVSAEKAQHSGYCDPQGNLLAFFLIFKIDEDFYLSFDTSLKETLQKRLQMFVMRSKVVLEDVSDNLIHMSIAGEFANLDIQRLLGAKVNDLYQTVQLKDNDHKATLIKVPGPHHRYEILGTVENIKKLWQTLKNNADVTNSNAWKLLDIVYGIPTVNQAIQGKLTAPFLNLDKLEAISFKKGCYPGQEVISRIHYRGKVTKRMLRFHCEEIISLTSGDEWTLIDEDNKSYKLMIIESSQDVLKGTVCLAVATLKALDLAKGQLKTTENHAVNLEPLAYDMSDNT